jgi:hypothetical protein
VVPLTALLLAIVAANVLWLVAFRRGGALNFDEAGYLSMSITDFYALRRMGLGGLARTVLEQPTQAPFVPFASSLVYVVLGRVSLLAAYAVQLVSYVVVVVAAWALARRLVDQWAGLAAAVCVAALPILIGFSHEYSFAVPAAAATAVAVWAAVSSELMTRKLVMVVWGAALAVMILSRTMTLAFLPSFALLAVAHLAVSRRRRESAVGLACGVGAALVVAGPWYYRQGASVWTYLTSYGYGASSGQYGATRTLFTPSTWPTYVSDTIDRSVWLPLAIVLLAGTATLVWLFFARLRRGDLTARKALASPWTYLAVVVAEGILALTSSQNRGSGFPAPLLPLATVLAVAALARATRARRGVRYATLAAVVLLALPSLIAASAFDVAGQPRFVSVPALGPVTVVDMRGPYTLYAQEMLEYTPGDPRGLAWRRAGDQVSRAVDELSGQRPDFPMVMAFAHSLLNGNTVRLEELLDHGGSPPVYALTPSTDAGGYGAQLDATLGEGPGAVLVTTDETGVFPPVLDVDALRAALTDRGFELGRTVPLPDGARVEVWVRGATSASDRAARPRPRRA